MTAKIVDGRALARAIEDRVAAEVQRLSNEAPVRLVAVAVGEAGASDVYLRNQAKACSRVGIRFKTARLPGSSSQSTLHDSLHSLAATPRVNGIILQMPLPAGLDARAAQEAMDPRKDVEGIHPNNLGCLAGGNPLLSPCTARAAVHVLEAEGVQIEGAEAVVVGHSAIVGKPAALLLLDRLATVTVCHIATRDLAAHTRNADIVVVAVGKAGLITSDMLKPGAAVVDVGINMVDGPEGKKRIVGDVDPSAEEVAGLLTPVPRGVGPITVAMLLENTVMAARIQRGLPPAF
jgi:methylenetetrahydrofolate dehydrogenase (NADP+)/methenyltetrahydrofolate cyclohydrolase